MEPDPDEEETEYENLDDARKRHWGVVFEDNYVGVDDKKIFLHDKRWDVCMNEKEALIKDGYSVE